MVIWEKTKSRLAWQEMQGAVKEALRKTLLEQ